METLNLNTVIAIADGSDGVPTLATAQVIATLLDWQQIILQPETVNQNPHLPHKSLLLLPEAHLLEYLPLLRLQGYSGAVVILSDLPFSSLKQRYPILKAQQGSHLAWGSPWQITTLFEQLPDLIPLEPANLESIQAQLKFLVEGRDRQLEEIIFPALKQLQQATPDFSTILTTLDDIFSDLLAQTPDARHKLMQIDGQETTLHSHFRKLMESLTRSQSVTPEQIANLQTIFETWQQIVRRTGEGLKFNASSN